MKKWRAIDSGMVLDRRSISRESFSHQGRFRADRSFISSHVGEEAAKRGKKQTQTLEFRFPIDDYHQVRCAFSLILTPFCVINLTRRLAR